MSVELYRTVQTEEAKINNTVVKNVNFHNGSVFGVSKIKIEVIFKFHSNIGRIRI